MKRVMVLDNKKYVVDRFYRGHSIYQERTPNGYKVSQSWAVINDDGLIIQIPSYNDVCLEEVLDAIDLAEEEGEYDFKANKVFYSYTDPVYVVHPNGKERV